MDYIGGAGGEGNDGDGNDGEGNYGEGNDSDGNDGDGNDNEHKTTSDVCIVHQGANFAYRHRRC